MATRLDDLTLNRGGLAMGEQSQTVTKYNNPTMRTAASQRATAPNRLATAPMQMPGISYDNTNQTTRGAAESVANPAIAESLRRSLIEQQRLSGPTYGSQSLGDRRARARAITANQANVTAGLGAVGQMRQSQVTAEGNRIGADADILSRRLMEAGGTERTAMTEAGANSRSLLGSETSRFTAGLQSDSALAVEEARGRNALAVDNNLNPMQQQAMDIGNDYRQRVGESGDEEAYARANLDVLNQLNNPNYVVGATAPPATGVWVDSSGREVTGPKEVADRVNVGRAYAENPWLSGAPSDLQAEVQQFIGGGASPADVDAFVAQKAAEAAAMARAEEEARVQEAADRTAEREASSQRKQTLLQGLDSSNPFLRDLRYVGGGL